jgi:hypothetical protein
VEGATAANDTGIQEAYVNIRYGKGLSSDSVIIAIRTLLHLLLGRPHTINKAKDIVRARCFFSEESFDSRITTEQRMLNVLAVINFALF